MNLYYLSLTFEQGEAYSRQPKVDGQVIVTLAIPLRFLRGVPL